MRILQFLQVAGDDVDLGAPAVIEIGARGQQFVPLKVAQVSLHAVVKGDGLIVCGTDRVPGKRNDGAVRVLALDLGDHGRPAFDGVFVIAAGKTEVLAKQRRIFPGQIVGAISPAGNGVGEIVLASEGVVPGDGIDEAQQSFRLRRGMRVDGGGPGRRQRGGGEVVLRLACGRVLRDGITGAREQHQRDWDSSSRMHRG